MSIIFKSGEISTRLGTTTQTIRRWVYRYADLFSQEAREGKYHINYTYDDAVLIATIHHLSQTGLHLDDIEIQLRLGFRYHDERLTMSTEDESLKFEGDNGKIPKALRLELKLTRVRMEEVLAEKEAAQKKVDQLQQNIASLMREIAEMKYQMGMMEGELNTLRRQTQQTQG